MGSLSFWLSMVLISLLSGFGGGFYVEHLRWIDAEAGRPVAVARIKETIRVVDRKKVGELQAQVEAFKNINASLEKDLDYARSQNTGTCTLGPAYIRVWDAKLEGRPVGVPGDSGGVPAAGQAGRDATPDDLLANVAHNAPAYLEEHAKLDKVREWACRVQKQGCPPK